MSWKVLLKNRWFWNYFWMLLQGAIVAVTWFGILFAAICCAIFGCSQYSLWGSKLRGAKHGSSSENVHQHECFFNQLFSALIGRLQKSLLSVSTPKIIVYHQPSAILKSSWHAFATGFVQILKGFIYTCLPLSTHAGQAHHHLPHAGRGKEKSHHFEQHAKQSRRPTTKSEQSRQSIVNFESFLSVATIIYIHHVKII